MLAFGPSTMNDIDQKIITAGPTEPMSSMLGTINNEEQYKTNAQEADSRIWRHCQQSHLNKHYIFSPDTDTYIIGLTNHKQGAETFIDLTQLGSEDTKIMSLNELRVAAGGCGWGWGLWFAPCSFLCSVLQISYSTLSRQFSDLLSSGFALGQ